MQLEPQAHRPAEQVHPETLAELPQVQPRLEEQVSAPRPLPAPDIVPAVPVASAAPIAAPAPAVQSRAATIAPSAERQPVDPSAYLSSAGLQMVETRPGMAQARSSEPEAAPLGRPRPERPPAPAQEELVQIETRK